LLGVTETSVRWVVG